MNITRKDFLRLTSATSMAVAIEAAVTACGGGGGGGDSSSSSSSANASTSTGTGSGSITVSNPSSGTGDGTTITPPTTPPASPSRSGYWSNPATWAGAGVPANFIPTAADNIYISSAQTVYLDGDCVCGTLTIFGTLRSLDPTSPDIKNISLTTGNINIMGSGALQIGTEAAPFPANLTATITLNGAEVGRVRRTVLGTTLGFTNSGEGRSIRVESGGRLTLIGVAPATKRTKLAAHAAAGASSFTVIDNTGWKTNDEIVIGTTDFYGVSVPEKLTLQSNASGTSIQSRTTIASARWGALQYVTDTGMSLTPGTLTGVPPIVGTASATPTTVDERAMVINLTRNIVIQGANDTAWTTSKFGAHCMFMGRTSDIKLDGVQLRRVGQAGALGRYPLHWHMMSYNMPSGMDAVSDGTFLGAVVGGHYAKNCSVSESGQRMIVIHGTWGVTLDSNVGFDITGHAIFLEDGSERNNVITNNSILKVRAPTSANKLLNHDVGSGTADATGVTNKQGTTAYWNTNPANTWRNNWANDCEGCGFWSSFSENYFGLSINVPNSQTGATPNPMYTNLTLIEGTVSMGNNGVGQLTNDRVIDALGNTGELSYKASFLSYPIKNLQLYKNNGGGYSNRVDNPQYQNFTAADNAGQDIFGQTTVDSSVMVNSLVVAETLNNSTSKTGSSYKAAFATYHEFLSFKNCLVVGYVYKAGLQQDSLHGFLGGGIFRLEDLYTQGLFSLSNNTDNKLVACNAPFRALPPIYDGAALNNRNWSLAGALYDKTGMFGIQGKYWIFNLPFLTYGAASPVNITSGMPSNGVVTTTKYFSIDQFRHSDDFTVSSLAISVDRQDSSGNVVGNWTVGSGYTSVMLGNMRNFAVMAGGRYAMNMPGHMSNDYIDVSVNCANMASGDIFMLGVPFSGSLRPAKVFQQAGNLIRVGYSLAGKVDLSSPYISSFISNGYARYLTSTSSLANVVADTTGLIYYQDTANNLIWMQVNMYPLIQAAIARNNYSSDWQEIEYQRSTIAISV